MNAPDLSALNTPTLAVFAALAIMSAMAITVAFLKIFQFTRLGVGKTKKADAVLDQWLNHQTSEAMQTTVQGKSVLMRVLHSVFSAIQARPDEPSFAEELGRQTALVEIGAMTRRLRVLDMVIQAAPMLGLLGTVIGMIDAFSTLAASDGVVDQALLAGGIWTALTTTAAGLAIALVTYFVATWLEGRVESERQSIEAAMSAAIHGRIDTQAKQG
ncbi:biopolymer transport protein ExbB [Cognatiyoonia koreensis]|uniref:Biopolymer transport protein ExbB n=1 Tax=Cognatiyoonia koreensis TaxID=364200 RepID=A0A1I0RHD6_9RHOB|nr:MotA/TolQ/ExbB proton channel family protein [Cognatiyoonia koreensis]SEW40091.1 biopolymer transport protein ExbB [Cognatiyoonia koreensis]